MARAPGLLTTLLFHKPYGVLSQFTPEPGSAWGCLADHIDSPGVYAAGRLDADSEGLLLLTANGRLQQRLTDPRWGHWRRYWAQVEGLCDDAALQRLREGVLIQGQRTLPAKARALEDPGLPPRDPPIRQRASIPTSWLDLELREGRNRQIRRTAELLGHPVLDLQRTAIGAIDLGALPEGRWRRLDPREWEPQHPWP